MNAPTFLDRADAYLGAQLRDRAAPVPPPPFVTLSREAGAGGSTVARLLARRLNGTAPPGEVWRVHEGNLTARMLAANQLDPHVARFLPEDRVPELAASIGELVGLHPNLWNLVRKLNEHIRRLATAGHVILVGRGASFATAGLPNGLHVRLVAPAPQRARRLAALYAIPEEHARDEVARRDAARRRYVRATFDADIGEPSAYGLCINTAELSFAQAADLIVERLGRGGARARAA